VSHYAIDALTQLVKREESQPDRVRDTLLARKNFTSDNQYPFGDAEVLHNFHAWLKMAEEKGAIRLEWEKYHEGTSLERIRLIDARAASDLIRHVYLPDKLNGIKDNINYLPKDHWFNEFVDEILISWRQNRRKYGLAIDQPDRLNTVIKAILAIETMPETTVDYRQFGARQLGDSKVIESIKAPLAQIYRSKLGKPDLNNEDILSELNLVKMVHPLLISGPLKFNHQVSVDVKPYLGVPGKLLADFKLERQPEYLMTIENLSSFLEYTANIAHQAIIIYSGGYPTSRLQCFYRELASELKAPIYHWGDSDPHGFQILKTFQNLTDKTVIPHVMQYDEGGSFGQKQLKHIESMMPVNSVVDSILLEYLKTGVGLAEQETMAACAPRGL